MKKKTGLAEKGKAWRIATYVLLLFMILIAVFPAIWMLSTAIKSPVELYDMPPEIIPDEPTLGNSSPYCKTQRCIKRSSIAWSSRSVL